MKLKLENTLKGDSHQIEILPRLSFFWSDGAYCVGFGWLFLSFDLWFGNIENLV